MNAALLIMLVVLGLATAMVSLLAIWLLEQNRRLRAELELESAQLQVTVVKNAKMRATLREALQPLYNMMVACEGPNHEFSAAIKLYEDTRQGSQYTSENVTRMQMQFASEWQDPLRAANDAFDKLHQLLPEVEIGQLIDACQVSVQVKECRHRWYQPSLAHIERCAKCGLERPKL